jgi:hypothetical protein
MMVRDPMFRAMLEQFLRNRDTWPNPDVMSDKSIWDTCMQLYWWGQIPSNPFRGGESEV